MSRNKKSRKPGSTGDVDLIITRNRSASDIEGRLRKRIKKRKGQKAGNRHSIVVGQKTGTTAQIKDPRLGSKKKIPLVVETKKTLNKQERRLNDEKELAILESDAQLMVLIDRLDNGEKLGAGLQKYVDEKLDRIEYLMNKLGLLESEDELDDELLFEQEESLLDEETLLKEAIAAEKVATASNARAKKSTSDDDLLSQFERLDLNELT